jgi:CIC family chloride channel protein
VGNENRRFKEEIGYLNKWVPIAILIGLVAGIGAVAFAFAINWFTTFFLGSGIGFIPPSPVGEGSVTYAFSPYPYLIPLVTTLGGLISGLIVYKLAPEAEGHGTDAAIDAFHNKKGFIRARVPIVKLIASAVTIGSGGSAGREGPSAQIGAGFGSLLGRMMRLKAHDRSIAVAIGIGAGIGAIFKAPFGGAVLAAEILYIGDFEMAALPPALIASTIGYSVYASVYGWTPIFGTATQYIYHDPVYLPIYGILGLMCGAGAFLYVRSFYGIRDIFRRWKVPNYVKPAVGGLMVGLMALALPEVLGMGYGWLQIAINGDFTVLTMGIVVALIFAKIVATSLTVGSGGSGGVFAPALVIGGMTGTALWMACGAVIPGFSVASAPFVIVGMMAFFGAAGKVPIAVILMVAEMTASYALLVPAMIATAIAYVISGKNTIYRSQLPSKADSPAHRGEYSIEVLRGAKVKERMTKNVIATRPDSSVSSAMRTLHENKIKGLPVVDDANHVVGIVTFEDLLKVPKDWTDATLVSTVMTKKVWFALPDDNLGFAFERMLDHKIGRLPVVNDLESRLLVGIISREDIGRAYHESVQMMLSDES